MPRKPKDFTTRTVENVAFIHSGEHGELSPRDIEQLSRLVPLFLELETDHRRNSVIMQARNALAAQKVRRVLDRQG